MDIEFANFLTTLGCGFWHWIPGTWLIIIHQAMTVHEISQNIKQYFPGVQFMVHTVNGNEAWLLNGFGDSAAPSPAGKWLLEIWSPQ
ncbi:hypothetical protein [Chryseolinea lacunae]|uniref:Uncharacterized protein n=1 Tax=Chryseolinea lacunae TaxID=2801331 RepID=A0ABS1L238_9BACT|nr:hypothetical protein [Chryseolinea lacunae]MBL0744591.1 hypothetical protein [Chryseolinea lacunae]